MMFSTLYLILISFNFFPIFVMYRLTVGITPLARLYPFPTVYVGYQLVGKVRPSLAGQLKHLVISVFSSLAISFVELGLHHFRPQASVYRIAVFVRKPFVDELHQFVVVFFSHHLPCPSAVDSPIYEVT